MTDSEPIKISLTKEEAEWVKAIVISQADYSHHNEPILQKLKTAQFEPGFYWARNEGHLTAIRLESGGSFAWLGSGGIGHLSDMDRKFTLGPKITPPEDF